MIGLHISYDWCHICGHRSPASVDVFYPKNAEHSTEDETRYVRICRACASKIAEAASASHPV